MGKADILKQNQFTTGTVRGKAAVGVFGKRAAMRAILAKRVEGAQAAVWVQSRKISG